MRMHKHLFSKLGNILVGRAVEKYGLENFVFLVAALLLEIVPYQDSVDVKLLLVAALLLEKTIILSPCVLNITLLR